MKKFSLHAQPVSRPFNFILAFGLPLLAMLAMLAFNVSVIDFHLARMFYVPGLGFSGRHNYWLETVLHERVKQLVILVALTLIAAWVASLVKSRLRVWRRPLGYTVLTIGLCTGIVTPLKALTDVQCPWSLQAFGGSEPYVSLLGDRVDSPTPGRCWPGGMPLLDLRSWRCISHCVIGIYAPAELHWSWPWDSAPFYRLAE